MLATLNNNDYPLILHNRMYIKTIDTGKEILVIGFYNFRYSEFERLVNDLQRS